MKKVILTLSILSVLLFMTSCLDDKSNNYTDATFVYIDKADDGTAFGKKISNRGFYGNITMVSPEIKVEDVGKIKVMTYSWDEANGVTTLSKDGESFAADNVTNTGKSLDVDETLLNVLPMPEIEKPNSLLEILPPLYADNKDFMGDLWIFQYTYKSLKDQEGELKFYKRAEDPDNPNKVIIDINLELEAPEEGATDSENKTGMVALNMTPLRALYTIKDPGEKKELEIEFHYYINDKPQKSVRTYKLTIGE